MKTSDEDGISRRDFFRTASLAAAAAGSGVGLGSAKGQEPGPERVQDEGPLSAIHAHVCGLHFYSGEMNRQVIAHHYCSHLNPDVRQCVIYDSDRKPARLVGIEYVISSGLFATLPAEEKKFWHSHAYEVKSGQLIAPGISADAEEELMSDFAGTYGKTWYTWQVDRDDRVPLGIPRLMMAFTADGQADPSLLARRDGEYGISSQEKKRSRAGIGAPPIQPGADAWQKGWAIQLESKAVMMKAAP